MTTCAYNFIPIDILEATTIASLAEHHLPTAGGLLDQSSWFLDFWSAFRNDVAKLEAEELERIRNRSRV